MKPNTEFVNHMKSQLKQWDDDVAALADQAKAASGEARASYDAGLLKLQASRETAQKTFRDICVASESAAIQLHASMETALAAMRTGLESMSEHFHK